jgi:hypothetical protein
MNALYNYFFPTQKSEPFPPKIISVCFSRRDVIYFVSLPEVATMTVRTIRELRPLIVAHMCDTYVVEESENSILILDAMDKRLEPEDPTT